MTLRSGLGLSFAPGRCEDGDRIAAGCDDGDSPAGGSLVDGPAAGPAAGPAWRSSSPVNDMRASSEAAPPVSDVKSVSSCTWKGGS
jgi:hypothetical protein